VILPVNYYREEDARRDVGLESGKPARLSSRLALSLLAVVYMLR